MPVRARWVAEAHTPEALAIDGDVVYVVGAEVTAFELDDGCVRWRCEPEHAFEASGGVQIGLEGSDVLRVIAPFEYDLRIDRQSGLLLSRVSLSSPNPPGGFELFPHAAPTSFRIDPDLEETVALWPDGRIAWRLVVDVPDYDPLGPVASGNGIVYVASSGHVLVLDRR